MRQFSINDVELSQMTPYSQQDVELSQMTPYYLQDVELSLMTPDYQIYTLLTEWQIVTLSARGFDLATFQLQVQHSNTPTTRLPAAQGVSCRPKVCPIWALDL